MVIAEENDMSVSREVMWRENCRCGTLKQGLRSLKSKHCTETWDREIT